MTRDSGIQKDACTKLQTLVADCRTLKSEAVAAGDEDFANLLLGFECVASCLSEELAMWILLKEEKPDEAWDSLCSAQMAAANAARAHNGFAHLETHAQRLEEIERLVFPPQVFVSAGIIVRHQECSICGSEYGDCEHLAGKPYWGKFCCIIAKDIEANHIAVVKNPADKRCRIVHFTVEGGERNRMTWKVEPIQPEKSSESTPSAEFQPKGEVVPRESRQATARLMHSDYSRKSTGTKAR
jgi:hypothetical protein